MISKRGSVTVAIIALLSGCAALEKTPAVVVPASPAPVEGRDPSTTTLPAPAPGSEGGMPLRSGPDSKSINITPLTEYADLDKIDLAKGGIFTNSYTRLRISSHVHADASSGGATSSLNYDERNWIRRYFVGKKFDSNLTVKIAVGEYETTIPLVTVSHQSDTNGEQWSRSISRYLLNFPLFLVKPDGEASIPTLTLKVSGTKEYTSNMAAKALDLVVTSIQEISPESNVLTKLTTQSAKDKSRAIDNAIGKLFSNGLSEEQIVHRDLRMWNADGGISVTFTLPSEADWNEKVGKIGTWNISFEEPRPSIFSDWRICGADKPQIRCTITRSDALKNVHRNISYSQVLNFPISKSGKETGTISAYIMQQDWYSKALSEFTGDKTKDSAIADAMCLKIENNIVGLGLNNDDAGIVIWSFLMGFPRAPKMNAEAFNGTRPDGTPTSCAFAIANIRKNQS
jgi:hypothetical protein